MSWEDTIRDAVDKGHFTMGSINDSDFIINLLERRSKLRIIWELLNSPEYLQDNAYWYNFEREYQN